MYILPNTNIRLLSGIILDKKHKNTILFNDRNVQSSYFINKTVKSYSRCTYQRQTKAIRLEGRYEDVFMCNYLMFQNSSYSNKWFYAFIDNIEYVNDNAFEVYFTIDDMQTWLPSVGGNTLDYDIKECFVVREHSATDVVGENIITENFELGDITCTQIANSGHMNSYVAVICKASSGGETAGGYIGGLFTGCDYVIGIIDNASQVETLKQYLATLVDANEQDSVVSIFIMPSEFATNTNDYVEVEVTSVAKPTKIHGYEPRNKKLLTYPYNYLSVDCGNNDAIYRYEWFKNTPTGNCDFAILGCMSCNPQISLVPYGYNGVDGGLNYTEKLVMDGFPQVAWSIDSFRAWLAQEASASAIKAIGNIAMTAGGASTGNIPLLGGGLLGIANDVNNLVLASNRPPQAKGANTGTIDVATRTKDFWFKQMQINQDYAILIDEYFDAYGYATRAIKKPSISSRPHWNYIQTDGCVIAGKMPSEAIKNICSIFDKGITFWKNGDEIGDYSFDNSPE